MYGWGGSRKRIKEEEQIESKINVINQILMNKQLYSMLFVVHISLQL